MKQNFKRKLLAGLLSACMIFQTAGIVPVYAAENAADSGVTANIITAFAPLAQSEYTLPIGADEETIANVLVFPKTIKATVNKAEIELAVTWESDKALSTEKADTFTYTAKLTEDGNQSHTLADGVALPQIAVMVGDAVRTMAVDGWQYPASAEGIAWTGEGTSQSPYLIKTAQDLANLSYMVNNNSKEDTIYYRNTYFKLDNDIDLNEGFVFNANGVSSGEGSPKEWISIGVLNGSMGQISPFGGIFDGSRYTIRGLYVDDTTSQTGNGLFGSTGFATIKNLNLENVYINCNNSCVGGLVGLTFSGDIIENCTVNAYINRTSGAGAVNGVGGIVGSTYGCDCEVRNCEFDGQITVGKLGVESGYAAPYIGGIVGDNYGYIADCINKGSVGSTSQDKVGGIAGANNVPYGRNENVIPEKTGVVEKCVNTGNVKGCESTGGIAGYSESWGTKIENTGIIRNCLNLGSVTDVAKSALSGGIIGYCNSTDVKNCYNNAQITGTGGSIGGIVGKQFSNQVSDCYFLQSDSINSGLTVVGARNNNTVPEPTSSNPMSQIQASSGEASYLLNGSSGSGIPIWYQSIGTDTYPVLDSTHKVVYQYENAEGTKYYSNALPNEITAVAGKTSKVYDAAPFTISTNNGDNFSWNGTGIATIEGYYTNGEGSTYTATTVEGSGTTVVGGAPVKAGTYYVKLNVSADDDYMAVTAYMSFAITQSSTTFGDTLKTYDINDTTEKSTFTYGDTITVKATPKATGTAARSLSAPSTNQMALYDSKNNQISTAVDAGANGVYTMTYDTKAKDLVIGSNTITAKYVGNDNMSDYSGTVDVTLNKKAISSATVTAGATKVYDGTDSFTGIALTPNATDLGGDTVTATAVGTTTDANVGATKAFTATSITLAGAQADYYSLAAGAVSGTVAITTVTPTVTVTAEKKQVSFFSLGNRDDTIILKATVTGVTGGTVPTGKVTFKHGGTTIATNVEMTNGVATYEWVNPNVANYTITAEFAATADTNYGNATGTSTAFDIDKAEQKALNISGVPNKVTYGDSTFTLSTTGGSGTGTTVTYAVTTGSDVVSVVESTGVVTVLKAGTVTITATKAGDGNYNAKTGTVEITVQSATPTVTWGTAEQSTTYTGSPVLASVLTAPTVTLVKGESFGSTIQYAYKYVGGLNKGLFADYTDGLPTDAGKYDIKAYVAADGNYAAGESTNTMTLTVNKYIPSLTINTMNGKTYDGTAMANPTAGNMTISGTNYADVTFAYSKNSDMNNPLAEAPKDAGTYYVQASVEAGDNISAASSEVVSFTITKASASGVSQEYPVMKELAKDYSFDLSKLLPSISSTQEYGSVTYAIVSTDNADNVLTEVPTSSGIVNGKLTLKVTNVADKDKTATVSISITTDNFSVTNAAITVKTVDKIPLTISNVTMAERVYNGSAYAYTGTPTFTNTTDNKAVTGVSFTKKYEGRAGTTYTKSETAPTNAGCYNLILTVSGTSAETYAGTLNMPFDITQKEVTVKARDKDILMGVEIPSLSYPVLNTDYTVAGFIGDDTLTGTVSMSYAGEPDNTKHGSYPINISGGTVSDNYTVKYENGTLTISIDVSLITAAITAANNAKGGIAIYDTAASSVAYGTKFVTTAEMSTLNTAIQTATDAKTTCATLAQIQAVAKALDDAVTDFKAAIKTGTYTAPSGDDDGDDDSSSGGAVTPPPATIISTKPNSPTTCEIKAPAIVDKNGNASITVTDKTVADAIKKAQDEAKKNGTEKNGVSVALNVDTGKQKPDSISANLPKAVQDTLIREKVAEFKVTSQAVSLSFDSKALQEIQKQAGGDVTINVSKADVSKLSKEAQEKIGNRPVFNLYITGKNGEIISDFGGGSVTVSIPYTLQEGENPDNLQAYFIDAKGKLHEVTSTYDPVTKCLVFVTNHFSTYGIGYKENAPKFNDIEKHWAKNDIEFVTARGLLSGTDKATFSPNSDMTRGMFVTALGRLAGIDTNSYTNGKFTDVKKDAYYAPFANWAASNGITNGTTATTFSPDKTVTRQEMAAFMASYAKIMGYTLPKTCTVVTFVDTANVASWASEAVKSMQMAGVIMGKDGNHFDPTGTATRAEVSAVLHRYVELIIDRATAQRLMP